MTSESPDAGPPPASPEGQRVACPTCRTRVPWRGNPHRPFCSLTCRLVDLGYWLDERRGIPAHDAGADDPPDVP